VSFFLANAERREVFSWFPSQSIPQKKKREEKGDREGVFVMLDEIMLFVCYTSS
jgi:hypothetical protein